MYHSQLQSARKDIPSKLDFGMSTNATDVFWKYVFIAVAVGTFFLSSIIVIVGNPHKLSNPIDPDGNPCGQGDAADYPYIYFVTPSQEYLKRTVCVKECKVYDKQPSLNDSLECFPNSLVKQCNFSISKANDRSEEVMLYDTAVYLGKICMPKNVVYYKMILQALHISTFDQILSDFYISFPYIIFFGLIAFLLSFGTQYMIDRKDLIKLSIKLFVILSTAGFLLLGALFLKRAFSIATASLPDDKDVMGDKDQLMQEIDSKNSSTVGNLIFAAFCFFNGFIYIKSYIDNDSSTDRDRKQVIELKDRILSFIADVIRFQNLNYLPVFAFAAFLCICLLFFRVVLNTFSLGSTTNEDDSGYPFEQFSTNSFAYLLMAVLFVGFFWVFIFIIQTCEYLVYYLCLQEIRIKFSQQSRNSEQIRDLTSIFGTEGRQIWEYRIGTIAKCSILYFIFYFPRSFLEWIDTSYQRKIDSEKQKALKQNPNADIDSLVIQHDVVMKIERSISLWYEQSFMKSIQPYGFIQTIDQEKPFSAAGKDVQIMIDNTAYWFEDMLDEGELFENQIKYSICFLVCLAFILLISTQNLDISTIAVPVGLMFIISYVISLLYVNMYGSIYSILIIYYLNYRSNQYGNGQNSYVANSIQFTNFKQYVDELIPEDDVSTLPQKRSLWPPEVN